MLENSGTFIRAFGFVGAFAAIILVSGCGSDPSAPSVDSAIRESRVTTTDMSVASVNPDSATQDTTLDVVISGSGFVAGTSAKWALAGVEDSTQVRTNSTRFVSSRQLVANITISPSATIAKWDVVLRAAGKKGGIGSEAFAIKAKQNSDLNSRLNYVVSNQVDVAAPGAAPNLQSAGVIGDGRLRDGSSANGGDSEYQSRFCGSTGSVENMLQPNGSPGNGNLVAQPGNGPVVCNGAARYFSISLDGVWTQLDPQVRVPAVWLLPVGGSTVTTASIAINFSDCTMLEFDPVYGGSNVILTRLDNGVGVRKWRVTSQGTHTAACVIGVKGPSVWKPTGKKYFLPFGMTITEVPYPWPSYP